VSCKFKNQSLRLQIWIILAGVLLSFVLITLLVIPPFRIIEHLILNSDKKLINRIGPPANKIKNNLR
jgi:hypothetical protein